MEKKSREWNRQDGSQSKRDGIGKTSVVKTHNETKKMPVSSGNASFGTGKTFPVRNQNERKKLPSTSSGNASVGIRPISAVKTQNERIPVKELENPSNSRGKASVGTGKTSVVKNQNERKKLPSTSSRNVSVGSVVTIREMWMVSEKVKAAQLRDLIIQLNLDDETMNEIERTCNQNFLPVKKIVYMALQKWKHRNGRKATRYVLSRALVAIKRGDIVHEVFPNFPEPADIKEMQKYYKGIQERMEEGQKERYQRIELPQVKWTNRDLPLEELYINLELLRSSDDGDKCKGGEIQLEELFHKRNGKEPVRILIEGGPGYGKTTLCLKLLSDWGRDKYYISSKFRMAFLFELRYFEQNDSIESVLKRECKAVGINENEGIRCIEAFENETLLVLDGFDEMNEESKRKFLALFQKNVYRSMFVLVTSRTGLFQVETKKGSGHVGLLEKKNENENVIDVWGKRVLIKGVTTDKIETFMRNYLQKAYQSLEVKIKSITGGEMREVFQCPLFLILLAMMLEERQLITISTKTTLYKEFFNFVVRRNLVRENKISDEEEVDIFNGSSEHFVVQILVLFGQFAIECLCQSKLLFEEREILQYCKDEMILKLGFLMKIPKMEGRKRENFYQPIHKSFLEFAAAFAMWKLIKNDEHEFKREIERIGEKGLKPTVDSLFYIFLGGLLNSQASVLFQSLIHHRSWFNIENLCFTNILLEIQDVHSFFPSFEPILDSFISSHYSIPGDKGSTREYFLSDIHSLILKHASDRRLIKVLNWNSDFSINLSGELYFDYLQFNLTDEVFKISSIEKISSINCKNVIYEFTRSFNTNHWNDLLSLFSSIQCEKVHFFFADQWNEINSIVFPLLHKELFEGRWREKRIDRLRFKLNRIDDPRLISLLVDLVKKERINEGIYMNIDRPWKRREENEINLLKRETEELFNSIIQSKIIREFIFDNEDDNFSPDIDSNRLTNSQVKRINFSCHWNLLESNETKTEKHALEEVQMESLDTEKNFSFIQDVQGIKYLRCKLIYFNSLVNMEWPGLKFVHELELDNIQPESLHLFLNSVSQLTNLQVLSLNDFSIETVPSNTDQLLFIHFFSSLHLRICEFLCIRNLESFSFLTEALMEGMKRKEQEEINSTLHSNEGKRVYLQELVIEIDYDKLNQCNEIEWIKKMLQNHHLKQCYFIDFYNDNKLEKFDILFPFNDNFRIFQEVDGMNSNNSRRSQFKFRWFEFKHRVCIKYLSE